MSHASTFQIWTKPKSRKTAPLQWSHLVARELLSKQLSAAMPAALQLLGKLGQADRVYVIEYNKSLDLFRNTHEWTRYGVTCHVEDLQNAPVELLGRLHTEARAGNAVAFMDVRNVPPQCEALQSEFLRQGNKSVLCLPLVHNGRLRGLFGFDNTRQYTKWSEEVINAMFECAELLAAALHGTRSADQQVAPSDFPELVYLRQGSDLRGVPLANIVAIRAHRNTSEVLLHDGEMMLPDTRSIKEWQRIVPAKQFMRIHRSAIVKVKAVRDLVRRSSGRWHVSLSHGEAVWNVSREEVDGLRSRMVAGKRQQ